MPPKKDGHFQGEDPDALLCRAARAGLVADVKALVDFEGASVNAQLHGITPLMYACIADAHTPFSMDGSSSERAAATTALVERRADLNCVGPSGWTALIFSAYYSQVQVMTVLMEAKADVNHVDDAGKSVSAWLRYGDLDRDHQKTSLKVIQRFGHDMSVDQLLKAGHLTSDFHSPIMMDSAVKGKMTVHQSTLKSARSDVGARSGLAPG